MPSPMFLFSLKNHRHSMLIESSYHEFALLELLN